MPHAKVQETMNARCAKRHGASNLKGGVSLVAHAGIAKMVKPGDPAGSELVQAELVEAWIKDGAKSP